MASFQRVALFILFDSIEADLLGHIRALSADSIQLTEAEQEKAAARLSAKADNSYNLADPYDLLYGLDLAEKYQVLMRCKDQMDDGSRSYFRSLSSQMMKSVSVRNDIMHGRPLTVDEHVFALAFAQGLLGKAGMWPTLANVYKEYTNNPAVFLERSVSFLDAESTGEVLHNLPVPDYDDTGFLPRQALERDLKKKILGRHPVVSVLGDGGNGKTALALRVLYSMVSTNDHQFDAIIWVSAKTSQLEVAGVREIESVATNAIDLMNAAATLEPDGSSPPDRLYKFLHDNKVLLVVDNYETVIGDEIARFAEDIPGESKLLFTSRKPVGSDLSVIVGEFSAEEAWVFLRRLIDAYAVQALASLPRSELDRYLKQLAYKPLLIKWFVLGVQSGLQPDQIAANRDAALRFCLDNVILTLGKEAQAVLIVLATVPVQLAAGVLAHIARLTHDQVADGLAELSRVGLIETAPSSEGKQIFGIRPFARTYVHRLLPPRADIAEKILAAYRQVEAEFQDQRYKAAGNPFRLTYFRVNSRPQMLAAKKLRQVMWYSKQSKFLLAEESLSDAKSLEPTYFETFRTEALLAVSQNDWGRAMAAYETAIELAPEEQQLHFFFAGLLLRLNEYDRAAEEFNRAMELGAPDAILFREAARNELYRCNFSEAQRLLEQAFKAGTEIAGERIKVMDLQLQIHGRELVYQVHHERFESACSAADRLSRYLGTIDVRTIDRRMSQHLSSYKTAVATLLANMPCDGARNVLELIQATEPHLPQANVETNAEKHVGTMKRGGRKPAFAFLQSDTCEDTYVHLDDVGPDLWAWMLNDGEVEFLRLPGDRGKAINVRIHSE